MVGIATVVCCQELKCGELKLGSVSGFLFVLSCHGAAAAYSFGVMAALCVCVSASPVATWRGDLKQSKHSAC